MKSSDTYHFIYKFSFKENIDPKEKSIYETHLVPKPILNLFTLFALLASLLSSAVIVTPAYAAEMIVNGNADTACRR